tara:strand:- start:1908 stop:2645 length:738 start_codon:yes stop_codon:yes gene_type:complete
MKDYNLKIIRDNLYIMIRFNLPRFAKHSYVKSSLSQCNIPEIGLVFKQSYDNLPFDPYLSNKTRQRRYANYHITNEGNDNFNIETTTKNIFIQNVMDDRKEPREFPLIELRTDPFLLNLLRLSSQMVHSNQSFHKISVDVHQVRQICYPDIGSHNSMEGIHQDGADYIISACVLNRHNISGGYSYVYDMNNKLLKSHLLREGEFIFQDDKILYHYVSPIQYLPCDTCTPEGYRDIIGLDIEILQL